MAQELRRFGCRCKRALTKSLSLATNIHLEEPVVTMELAKLVESGRRELVEVDIKAANYTASRILDPSLPETWTDFIRNQLKEHNCEVLDASYLEAVFTQKQARLWCYRLPKSLQSLIARVQRTEVSKLLSMPEAMQATVVGRSNDGFWLEVPSKELCGTVALPHPMSSHILSRRACGKAANILQLHQDLY